MQLESKVAIVTGAASGIGRATALLFAREGAKVVVADIAVPAGEEIAVEIRAAGGQAIFVRCDVSSAADVQAMIRTAVDTYGRLDILINNAGLTIVARVTETSDEVWEKTIAVNLRSVMLGCRYAIPEMLKGGGGAIVNTASMLGLVASPNQAPYAAAKGGVVSLTRQVAIDFAPQNIRVNCVCPGDVLTPMTERFLAESPDPAAALRNQMARIPMRRMAQPEELATTMLFLASDASSFVTGVALPVDGGLTAM